MVDIDPNKRPGIHEILRDNCTSNVAFSYIIDEADHLNHMFETSIFSFENLN